MKREIKFRVWDETTHSMIYFDLNDVQYNLFSIRVLASRNNWSNPLMQYTGLKDKKGKEIYEGDILKTDSGALQFVEYRDDLAQFVCRFAKGASTNIEPTWEVIGNIYENPKLIK